MTFVIAAYVIVFGAIGIYWWSLFFRFDRIYDELNAIGTVAEPASKPESLSKD